MSSITKLLMLNFVLFGKNSYLLILFFKVIALNSLHYIKNLKQTRKKKTKKKINEKRKTL